MRPIARQGARLAQHSRATSRGRVSSPAASKWEPILAGRVFSSCRTHRSTEPRPPDGHSERHTSFDERPEPQRQTGHDAAKGAENSRETAESEESKTMGNGGERRGWKSMRPRRGSGIPPPPPIPAWFLKHNVRLVAVPWAGRQTDKENPDQRQQGRMILHCVDQTTGHTLFTVPDYRPRFDPNIPRKQETTEAEQSGSEQASATTGDASDGLRASWSESSPESERKLFDPRFPNLPTATSAAGAAPWSQDGPATRILQMDATLNLLGCIFLEAELAARASMSLPHERLHQSSYAASRVDLSLVCADEKSHDRMDAMVRDLACNLDADVIRLDANDLEELTAEYVGQGHDAPGSYSNMGYDIFDGYEVAGLGGGGSKRSSSAADEGDEFDADKDDYEEDEDADHQPDHSMDMESIRRALHERRHELAKVLQGIGVAGITIDAPRVMRASPGARPSMPSSASAYVSRREDVEKLEALFESLLDAPKEKRASNPENRNDFVEFARSMMSQRQSGKEVFDQDLRSGRFERAVPLQWRSTTAHALVGYLGWNSRALKPSYIVNAQSQPPLPSLDDPKTPARPRTVVHVRDLKDICRSQLGNIAIRRLVRVVQKRRRVGEEIIIIGTTAQSGFGSFATFPGETEDFPFRTIAIPPFFKFNSKQEHHFLKGLAPSSPSTMNEPAYRRILEINLRHIQSMLRRLQPEFDLDLLGKDARRQMSLNGTYALTEKVFSFDQVQRLVLTTIGLAQSHAKSETVQPIHIALAAFWTDRVDQVVQGWLTNERNSTASKANGSEPTSQEGEKETKNDPGRSKMDEIKASCNPHETRLLTGIVDAQNIKTRFNDVHAPVETIDALKTLTMLSLLRPEAFKYGVLAHDRLPGLMLYGPPGTGKTLLAKAVAKESKATMLEVSGAQIYEKYVGEGEKMVRAVFSLAKKLSPCIVFIDEADAVFSSRSSHGGRNTHREIINQFLREWDGMNDHGVFIMVASNRPFDLDDAVLRRLPRRLLVDLPVAKDRESILGIHLKHELVDAAVSLPHLAAQTPLYSGSDLKNLCVAAALACVREENELLSASRRDDPDFKLPARRTLLPRHFDLAVAEISASISENMPSLAAIRRFDEQYGDRRGRRKKTGYGFGARDGEAADESSARVRQAPTIPPPPSSSGPSPPPPPPMQPPPPPS